MAPPCEKSSTWYHRVRRGLPCRTPWPKASTPKARTPTSRAGLQPYAFHTMTTDAAPAPLADPSLTEAMLRRPDLGGLDVVSSLEHFAIITYAIAPERLRPHVD